jgi:hypothetical protein
MFTDVRVHLHIARPLSKTPSAKYNGLFKGEYMSIRTLTEEEVAALNLSTPEQNAAALKNLIETTAATLKVVSFEEFLAEMPSESTTVVIQEYNRQISYGEIETAEDGEATFGDSMYVRSAVHVLEPTKNNLLAQILDQVALGSFTGTEQERIEAAAVQSMENFGLPTHCVKMSPNIYGIFSMEDFKYKHIGPAQGAVVCYRTACNIVFRVID